MTEGDLEFVQVVATMLAVPAFVHLVVRLDEQRLTPDQLARAWPIVTRDTVVFGSWQFGILFGMPALLVWFVKTRRLPWGLVLGLGAAAALLGVAIACTWGPEQVWGSPDR